MLKKKSLPERENARVKIMSKQEKRLKGKSNEKEKLPIPEVTEKNILQGGGMNSREKK